MIAIIVWSPFSGTFRGAVGERRPGDRDSIIVETSCCRVPTILASSRIKPWESQTRTMMAVVVQGAPHIISNNRTVQFPPRVVVSQNLQNRSGQI
jgi:hypothetical protein